MAVDALDLEVADGELMVLVGPVRLRQVDGAADGCGLDEPSEGTIVIGERDVAGVSPAARDIAMVFQSYALYPHMTVRKNLAFPLERRRMPKERDRPRVARGERRCWGWPSCSAESRPSSRAASASGWRWAGRSSASRSCSCWTSRSRISTPSCAPSFGPS